MGKITTYLITISGAMLVFYVMGLLPNETASSSLLSLILNPENIFDSEWYTSSYFFLITLGGLSIAAIGKFFLGNPELVFLAPVASFLLNIGLDILLVYNRIASTSNIIAIMILSPFILMYVLACIEWFRGRD